MKRRTIGILGVLAMALSLGVATNAQEPAPLPFPASIGDVAAVRLVEVKDVSGQVVLSGTFGASVQTTSGTERTAPLTAVTGATAKGTAEFEVGTATGVAMNELDVDIDDLAPSTQYRLFIDEVEIASFTTDADGDAELEFGEDDA